MKNCNRSPCSLTACAMVSCTFTLSDVKHHPVTGITPRQGRDHKWNEQSSTLSMFGSEAVTCPLQPAGNLIQQSKVDFWRTETKAALSDAIWQAQEGLFEPTKLKLIICPVIIKQILLNASQLYESRREKNGFLPHKNIPWRMCFCMGLSVGSSPFQDYLFHT